MINKESLPIRTLKFAQMQVIALAEYLSDKRKWYTGSCPSTYKEQDWDKIQTHYKIVEIEQIANLRYYEFLVNYIESDYYDNTGTGWQLYQKTIGNELIQVDQKIKELEGSASGILDGSLKTITLESESGNLMKELEVGYVFSSAMEDVFKFENYRDALLLMKEEMKAFIEKREFSSKGNARSIRNWN
jgi:hypothetical protein